MQMCQSTRALPLLLLATTALAVPSADAFELKDLLTPGISVKSWLKRQLMEVENFLGDDLDAESKMDGVDNDTMIVQTIEPVLMPHHCAMMKDAGAKHLRLPSLLAEPALLDMETRPDALDALFYTIDSAMSEDLPIVLDMDLAKVAGGPSIEFLAPFMSFHPEPLMDDVTAEVAGMHMLPYMSQLVEELATGVARASRENPGKMIFVDIEQDGDDVSVSTNNQAIIEAIKKVAPDVNIVSNVSEFVETEIDDDEENEASMPFEGTGMEYDPDYFEKLNEFFSDQESMNGAEDDDAETQESAAANMEAEADLDIPVREMRETH